MFETEKFSLIAGNLFLDFVNTEKMRDGKAFETLETFADFLAWAVAVELIEAAQAEEIYGKWSDENTTDAFLSEAVEFRKLLREMAEQIAAERAVSGATVAALN